MQPDLSRRTALTVAGAGMVLLAGGCRIRNPIAEQATAPPAPADPDITLRDTAREVIGAQLALCRALAATTPGNRRSATVLISLHEAHLDALEDRADAPLPSAPPTPATPAAVRSGEVRLQSTLAGLAQRSQSGGFARLLASMSASIGQTLETAR